MLRTLLSGRGNTGGATMWLLLNQRCLETEPATDPSLFPPSSSAKPPRCSWFEHTRSSCCSCPTTSESPSSCPPPHPLSLPAPHPLSPPAPHSPSAEKRYEKTINKLILQNGMKISMLPQIFDSRSFDPHELGLCASRSRLACLSLKYYP
jgi:hypothetical protein